MNGRCDHCGLNLVKHDRRIHKYCPRCGTLISPQKRKEIQKTLVITFILAIVIPILLLTLYNVLITS